MLFHTYVIFIKYYALSSVHKLLIILVVIPSWISKIIAFENIDWILKYFLIPQIFVLDQQQPFECDHWTIVVERVRAESTDKLWVVSSVGNYDRRGTKSVVLEQRTSRDVLQYWEQRSRRKLPENIGPWHASPAICHRVGRT